MFFSAEVTKKMWKNNQKYPNFRPTCRGVHKYVERFSAIRYYDRCG